MPSYCTNLLVVEGPLHDLQCFEEKAKTKYRRSTLLDFFAVFCPSSETNQENSLLEEEMKSDEEIMPLDLDNFKPDQRLDLFGEGDEDGTWTGTKWNAFNIELCKEIYQTFSEKEKNEIIHKGISFLPIVLADVICSYLQEMFGKLKYTFCTAWCPYNQETSNIMSKQFPTLYFHLYFAERNQEFFGYRKTYNGLTIDQFYHELPRTISGRDQMEEINIEFFKNYFPHYDWDLFYPLWERSG